MNDFTVYKTSGSISGLVSMMWGIRDNYLKDGKKAVVCHEFPKRIDQYEFDMMIPLMLSQEYIEDYCKYRGERFDVNLDVEGNNYYFPSLPIIQEKWIDIPTGISNPFKEKIVISFIKSRRSVEMNYAFLKNHEHEIIFAGEQGERDMFCSEWDLDIPNLQFDNYYEFAKVINGCRFVLGTTSLAYKLAIATKSPCVIEGNGKIQQESIKYYFNKLIQQA